MESKKALFISSWVSCSRLVRVPLAVENPIEVLRGGEAKGTGRHPFKRERHRIQRSPMSGLPNKEKV